MSKSTDVLTLLKAIERQPDRFIRKFSSYSMDIASIAASGSATPTVNIDAGSYFVWTKTTYSADIGGAAQTDSSRVIPLLEVQLFETGAERELFDSAMRIDDFAGTGQIPFILPVPYLMNPRTTVKGTFENLNGTDAYANVKLNFLGYRVYDLFADQPLDNTA